ncbi:hypothetical protein [Burkholderia sola]|uniref:hypothetical protein n=1 Tax=Burkholderia sola TaxID=2843302 RepID=UPI00338D5262
MPTDRPPLPDGPLPDERFDLFRPHRGGPVLSYTGAAAPLRARTIDGERMASVAAPDLPPLPGVAVQLAGPADSPFYADQVADALARYAALGGAPARDDAGDVRTASSDGDNASGPGLAGVPFYADQVAYARAHPLPDDAPSLAARTADSVASLVARFPFDVSGSRAAVPPSIALSTLGGEVAYHALSERHAAFIEPRSLTGLLDTLKPILAAMPKPAAGSGSTVARAAAVPTDPRRGPAASASRPLPSPSVAGSTQALDDQRLATSSMSASVPQLAAQVVSPGARAQHDAAFASPEWRVAMRVSTDAALGARAGDRGRSDRGARDGKSGRASTGLPTIVADMRGVSQYESRIAQRPAVVSGLPSAVEMAAALVRTETGRRASGEARKPFRIARDVAHAVDAGRDTGWRAATMATVGDQRYGRSRRGDPVYDNIMAPVAAAQHRSIEIDMPPHRAYRDVATSVVLASSGPSADADQKGAAAIGHVF